VQRIGWILLVLVTLGWVACEWPSQPPDAAEPATVWRHTRNGWEHRDRVLVRAVYRPALHPVVIASLEVLLTATAMLAVSRD
jgi:hypothetical protein